MSHATTPLQTLVVAAQNGDRKALGQILTRIQDMVHRLSIRMLADFEAAQDATQEILVLVVTRLSTFKGHSKFTTWVYRVATNYLLDQRRVHARTAGLTFEAFAADLEHGLVDDSRSPDEDVLLNELRVACTMAMLLCLKPEQRVVYVLGDILSFDHMEAATILEVTPATFRKRLSRARALVVKFTTRHCGLANTQAKCSCKRRLPAAIAQNRVQPHNLKYATDHPLRWADVHQEAKRLEGELQTLCLQQAMPAFACSDNLRRTIMHMGDPRTN